MFESDAFSKSKDHSVPITYRLFGESGDFLPKKIIKEIISRLPPIDLMLEPDITKDFG